MTDNDRAATAAELDGAYAILWLEEAARYFAKRPTNGEDAAHWSNVANAERATQIGSLVAALRRERDEAREEAGIAKASRYTLDTLREANARMAAALRQLIAAVEFEAFPIRDGDQVGRRANILLRCARDAEAALAQPPAPALTPSGHAWNCDYHLDQYEDECTCKPAPAATAPEQEMALVPREPTPAMLRAAAKAMSPGKRPTPDRVSCSEKHAIRYRAMIAAFQEPT